MTVFKIGPDGDILTTTENRIARSEGMEEIAQRIQTRLKLLLGEWFVDRNEGLPWFQEILEKGITNSGRSAIIKRAILVTDGVLGLDTFTPDDSQRLERILKISFSARTTAGTVTSGLSFP